MSLQASSDAPDEALIHVVQNLRADDREELEAVNYDLEPDLLASLRHCRAYQYIAFVDDLPAGIVGAFPMWPNVWSVYAMGTDAFPALTLTKFVRRVMLPTLLDMGVHRAECASIETHSRAHLWLESLGAVREATMPGYGKNGETFHRYVWNVRTAQSRQLSRNRRAG